MKTIQELIGKVGIEGASTYRGELRSLSNAAHAWATNTSRAGSRVLDVLSVVNKATMATAGIMASLASAGGVVGIGAAAIKAAADWEQLTVTMTALTGSADAAKEKLQFVKDLAIPATATTDQLARAALTLESFGVRAERALPVVAKLQAAFQFDPAALEKATSIIGRLAQGDFPDVELLAGMGMNRRQFAQQGVQFDPQGRLLSSARDTLDALDRIVQAKYGGILDAVSGTTNAKLATLTDRWQQALRTIGTVLGTELLPHIERLANWLDNLEKSGTLTMWAQRAVAAFRIVGTIIQWVGGIIGVVLTAIGVLTANLALALGGAALYLAATNGGSWIQKKIDAYYKSLKSDASKTTAIPAMPQDKHPDQGWGAGIPTDPVQNAIERNTRRTADNTAPDMRRYALGGGPLGQIGVTPVELAAVRSTGTGRVTVELRNGSSLETIFADAIADAITSMKRQGLL